MCRIRALDKACVAGINNHLTALVPGTKDRFLVYPFGLHWSEVTASSLLVVDEHGTVVKGKGAAEATAFYIHVVSSLTVF